MLLEKYLTEPRHIEVQVFADTHDHCVHLFERDCSVQRRHQKVLEEAPAPGMRRERRLEMGAAAIAAARAIGYVGAGTVEFIVDRSDAFFFMEMNTRLQVEHPVTEMITGLDLVEWQLRVAAGEALPLDQRQIEMRGHAIEARIYAEDPARGFLPSIGRIAHLRAPTPSTQVRIDTGVRAGDEISHYYDPMIAKLVVWGEDRGAALRQLRSALAAYQVVGVATNISFLQRLVAHRAFADAQLDTGLITRHHDALFPPAEPPDDTTLAIAALAELVRLREEAAARAQASADRWSPWHAIESWWLNAEAHAIALIFESGEANYLVELRVAGDAVVVRIGGREAAASILRAGDELELEFAGKRLRATVVPLREERYVFCEGWMRRLRLVDRLAHAGEEEPHAGHLAAPMSGTVIAVLVAPGDTVARGAPLLVLEAMKMEHTVAAPAAGIVSAVNYKAGDQVREGADLIDLDDAAPPRATV